MKIYIYLIVSVLFVFSCQEKKREDGQSLNLPKLLTGHWDYHVNHRSDTAISKTEESDSGTVKVFVLKTDSGLFHHSYFEDSLLEILPVENVGLSEFVFDSDSTGRIQNWEFLKFENGKSTESNSFIRKFHITTAGDTTKIFFIHPTLPVNPFELEFVKISKDTVILKSREGDEVFLFRSKDSMLP